MNKSTKRILNLKTATRKPGRVISEDSSVLLSQLGKFQLRLTSINRLFVSSGDVISFPYLSGASVQFDTPNFLVPDDVLAAVRRILEKQEEIRKKHADDWDEGDSLTFN